MLLVAASTALPQQSVFGRTHIGGVSTSLEVFNDYSWGGNEPQESIEEKMQKAGGFPKPENPKQSTHGVRVRVGGWGESWTANSM